MPKKQSSPVSTPVSACSVYERVKVLVEYLRLDEIKYKQTYPKFDENKRIILY